MVTAHGEPVVPLEGVDWLEPGERVLWHGQPAIDHRFRVRLWSRGIFIFAAIAIVAPAVAGHFLGLDLPFFIVGAVVTGLWIAVYVPYYARRLTRTRYTLTSRRAIVREATSGGGVRVIWAPLNSSRIKVKSRRSGSTDVAWGKSEGRIGTKDRPLILTARALGFMDRQEKELVTFVEVAKRSSLLSAIRGGRAALGLPPGFE